jgi:nitroreductase
MNVSEAIRSRRASKAFEPEGLLLSREILEDLIFEATRAPSEFNLQPWRFLVVRDRERKQALYDCCFKQEKIRQASALIVICGDTRGWERADKAAEELIETGYCDDSMSVPGMPVPPPGTQFDARALAERIKSTYVRDERVRLAMAYRNPAMAAMNLMLLATERGIATCPIAGFSEVQLRRAFEIPDRFVPVMIVALGMPSLDVGRPPVKPRRPLFEVVFHEDMASW